MKDLTKTEFSNNTAGLDLITYEFVKTKRIQRLIDELNELLLDQDIIYELVKHDGKD